MSKEQQTINEMALAICKSRGVAEVDDCSKCGRHADCLYYEIADRFIQSRLPQAERRGVDRANKDNNKRKRYDRTLYR